MVLKSRQFLHHSIVSIFAVFGCIASAFGQISGTIFSSDGEKLSFATVVIEGTTHGTTADLDGNFEIISTLREAKIVASYVGYENDTLSLSLIHI